MEVKCKVKHKDNVVHLFGDDRIRFEGGFEALAGESGLPGDVLFLMLMSLMVHGMIGPLVDEKPDGGLKLRFRIARDLREARELRKDIDKRAALNPETFENLEKVRDGLFGPIPEDV